MVKELNKKLYLGFFLVYSTNVNKSFKGLKVGFGVDVGSSVVWDIDKFVCDCVCSDYGITFGLYYVSDRGYYDQLFDGSSVGKSENSLLDESLEIYIAVLLYIYDIGRTKNAGVRRSVVWGIGIGVGAGVGRDFGGEVESGYSE